MQLSDLSPACRHAAEILKAKHPEVVFTSGRRGVADQARAMASNVVKNRLWIVQTYSVSQESIALHRWVQEHPKAVSVDQIAAGLAAIMAPWTADQKARLSAHFAGKAWDVRPVAGAAGEAIKATIRGLPGLRKFLETEGGLIRWHAQFD